MAVETKLQDEITLLHEMFGQVVLQHAGQEAFELVESVKAEARDFRSGDKAMGDRLADVLAGLDAQQLRIVIQAFSCVLELANLAEDRQRVRSLRNRERQSHPQPREDSPAAAIQELVSQGFTAEQLASALAKVDIELVFTAHPTEAKRKSLRAKLRRIRGLMERLQDTAQLPREVAATQAALKSELTKMWKTDLVRSEAPTVMEEVHRGMSFQEVLWDSIPRVMSDVRAASQACFPNQEVAPKRLIRFGSWMGGDRDGNPYVTCEVTEQTCLWLRRAALADHQQVCRRLAESISISCCDSDACQPVRQLVEQAVHQWPAAQQAIARVAPAEGYRQLLSIIDWRLGQTLQGNLNDPALDGAYAGSDELLADVEAIAQTLQATGNAAVLETELRPWIDQIHTFGFQAARLDIRQHAGVYRSVMEEIWKSANLISEEELPLSEERRMVLLLKTLPVAPNLSPVNRSEMTRETLDLFRLLRRIARRFGMEALGAHITSMTTHPSDMLTVLWLWRWSERADARNREYNAQADADLLLPIAPLLETIDDLSHGADILTAALAVPEYRQYVQAQNNEQMVMVGYSDSTKDGGYLAAQWALHRGQLKVFEAAQQQQVHVTFFHGRGGSLGRGGGPAARAILSLPSETFDGPVRLTEQGEVLAERYDDPSIAHRHLEQMLWSVLTASTQTASSEASAWRGVMDRLAEHSLKAYRELVDHPSFVPFFRTATPIAGIERLPIGSRPSRRKAGGKIEDLRAIPWVFSWTQSRCLLPAWYGLGEAVQQFLAAEPDAQRQLRTMYAEWPFFQATIDNSVLALAKANLPVFHRYADLADDPHAEELYQQIKAEYQRTTQAVLAITGCQELLDDVAWLKESITLRNHYVDPLNFVQIEIMRRSKQAEEGSPEADELGQLTQLAIKGVAAGMRTTG